MKQIMTKQQTPQTDKLKTYDRTPNSTIFLVTKEYCCYTLLHAIFSYGWKFDIEQESIVN
jgi:hypothetical protein